MARTKRPFLYIGQDNVKIPFDVTHVKIDPSVKEIRREAFIDCRFLEVVEFHSRLERIGEGAFCGCSSLRVIRIPSSVKCIGSGAFLCCENLAVVVLPRTLKVIEERLFLGCDSLRFLQIPPTVQEIRRGAFSYCKRLLSIELPIGLVKIGKIAFWGCQALRNIAIPSTTADIDKTEGDTIISACEKFKILNKSADDEIMKKLQNRFDALPIHELIYFQAPKSTIIESLSKQYQHHRNQYPHRFTEKKFKDCFEMTPFHILALSTTNQDVVEIFYALIKVYPKNMICEKDVWGHTPLEYLCWNHSDKSNELARAIMQHVILEPMKNFGLEDWRRDVQKQIDFFPIQEDSKAVVVEEEEEEMEQNALFLVTPEQVAERKARKLELIHYTVSKYERREAISVLESALWKLELEKLVGRQQSHKKLKSNESTPILVLNGESTKSSSRITCKADIVITNVLPFLGTICQEDYQIKTGLI